MESNISIYQFLDKELLVEDLLKLQQEITALRFDLKWYEMKLIEARFELDLKKKYKLKNLFKGRSR